jgi:hypothetical protein
MAQMQVESTAIEIVASTPGVLRSLLADVPQAVLEAPADGGWSPKDVVAHLVDAHGPAFTERFRRILEEDRPSIRPFDPSTRAQQNDYAAWPLDRLLDELERQREADREMLRGLDEAELRRSGVHEQAGEISVSDIAHYEACHDMTHLAQIVMMLRSHLAPKTGNMAVFLDE